MKILYITQYFTTPDQPGSLRHYSHARQWARSGHQVTVITSQVIHKAQAIPDSQQRMRLVQETVEGVCVLRIRSARSLRGFSGRMVNYLSFMYRAIGVGWRAAHSADVVVASSPPLFAAAAGALLARGKKTRFVMDVRDLWPRSAIALGFLRSRTLIWVARRLEQWLYEVADRITCATQGICENVAARGHEAKATVIRNGVDLDLFPCSTDRKDQLDERPVEIGYAGAQGVNNALDVLIEAAAELRYEPVRFVFIGRGPCTEQLQARAKELGLGNVVFPGLMPRSEVPHRLGLTDALVWPVYLHGQARDLVQLKRGAVPDKLYDYLALGKPVITSVPSESEAAGLIRRYGQGYFCDASPQGFVAAIREFLKQGSRRDLQQRAHEFRNAHARDIQAVRFLAVLEGLRGLEDGQASTEPDRAASMSRIIKRGIDLTMSMLGLLVAGPACILTALAIRLESTGPVIFRQQRAGKDGRVFTLYKFRTMVDRAPDGFVVADDPRITRLGRVLRMTSLDEIPQLWNVIRGDMSLVGPRPDRVFRAETYDDRIRKRLSVRPGIMGWAQLHDGRSMTWQERYEYDLEYSKNWCLGLDLRIIWRSVTRGKMVQREGDPRNGQN